MGIAESKVFAERQVTRALSEVDRSQHFPGKKVRAKQDIDQDFDEDGLLHVAKDADGRPVRIVRVLLPGVLQQNFVDHPAYRAEIRDREGCWYE
jgi:hypothetical protein